jgi:hypothetical protein
MTASTIFFVLLVLACPLMMMFMMRGGHGHGGPGGHGHGGQGGHAGGCHGGHGQEPEPREASTDDLRRRRPELDREIEHREQWEAEPERELEPTGWGKR